MVKSYSHVLSASSAISILTNFSSDIFFNLSISCGFMWAKDDKHDLTNIIRVDHSVQEGRATVLSPGKPYS